MVAEPMVEGLTNMDHQTKILAEVVTLTMLQQKFNKLVSLDMTDQAITPFGNIMCCTTTANIQRSDRKKQS